jgi:hypothetical protein
MCRCNPTLGTLCPTHQAERREQVLTAVADCLLAAVGERIDEPSGHAAEGGDR